jgi:hypothetical protein
MKHHFCRQPKHKPYGTKGTDPYCRPHDMCMVYSVSKKSIRFKAKQEIKKEIKDL